MHFIEFIKTANTYGDPLREYELTVGGVQIGVFWPTKEMHEFMIADVKTQNGMDVEADAVRDTTDALCDALEALRFDYGRTRLEVALALGRMARAARAT